MLYEWLYYNDLSSHKNAFWVVWTLQPVMYRKRLRNIITTEIILVFHETYSNIRKKKIVLRFQRNFLQILYVTYGISVVFVDEKFQTILNENDLTTLWNELLVIEKTLYSVHVLVKIIDVHFCSKVLLLYQYGLSWKK